MEDQQPLPSSAPEDDQSPAAPPAALSNASPSRAASTRSLTSKSKAGSRASLAGSQVLKRSAKSTPKASQTNVAAAVEAEVLDPSPGESTGTEKPDTAATSEEPQPDSGESRAQTDAGGVEEGSVVKPAEDGVEGSSSQIASEDKPPEQSTEAPPVEASTVSPEDGDLTEAAETSKVEQSRLEAMEHSMEQMITEAQEDFQEIGEEIEIVPAVGRILSSPPPADIQGFTFMNVNYDEDPDIPIMFIATRLSRSESVMSGAEVTTRAASASSRVRTPMLRASTPTLAETKKEDGNAEDRTTEINLAGALKDSTEALLEEGVDREALIAGIRLALDFREKYRADENHDGEKSVTDQEQRYANCMSALSDLRSEFETLNSTNQKIVNEYKLRLEERILEAESKATEFVKYKRNIALGAENSRTGKPLPTKVVDQLEATELRKEADVVAVRLENIKLRNKLRRHEQLLRQKEELADGLHLIDFEQLKIENQTYNEKIEERNEELLKLQKLQFVQGENVDLKRRLRHLDDEVSSNRDSLPIAKQARDALRSNSLALRQKNGLLGNTSLLRDFEEKVDETTDLKSRIDDLRACHADLCAETLAIKRRIHRKMLI
ncbi:hypothetical protein BC829DRAFT_439951 [Chytridium lagenaria]|nr:hypothetical protein BC829DRAFT_439951 [Chytridium lagenaria]